MFFYFLQIIQNKSFIKQITNKINNIYYYVTHFGSLAKQHKKKNQEIR